MIHRLGIVPTQPKTRENEMIKVGYGIQGVSGTNFADVASRSDVGAFLKALPETVAYAFVVNEDGTAVDFNSEVLDI